MLQILKYRNYRHLFFAQMVALLGTGLATVALSLLAFDLAGDRAGQVIGTALAIKMVAYVCIAPFASVLAERLPRRTMLVTLDLVRASVALALPFVTQVYEVYGLIAILQSVSAAFTPTYQSIIPDVLPHENDYTRALSLSRIAYDLENLISPALAGLLLLVTSWEVLFAGTVIGFLASAVLIVSVVLPKREAPEQTRGVLDSARRGFWIFRATPRLRGLMALNLVVSVAGSLVIVNTVVWVQGQFKLTEQYTALAFAVFGAGSMAAALALPALLRRWQDRPVMLTGGALLLGGLALALMIDRLALLLSVWAILGVGFSTVQTPIGRLLTRSSHSEDRPALFSAQFSLSHAGWLLTYPLAGWLGSVAGVQGTVLILFVLGMIFFVLAVRLWPAQDQRVIIHSHPDLPEGHPHKSQAGETHAHRFVIDELHPRWPG